MIRGPWLIVAASTGLALARLAGGDEAAEPDGVLSARSVASLAATCAACHGTNGHVENGSKVPAIAGLSQDYFATQMRAYVAGSIPSTVMQQIAKGYDARETAALGAYFAAQP